jgi:hypothetical protein
LRGGCCWLRDGQFTPALRLRAHRGRWRGGFFARCGRRWYFGKRLQARPRVGALQCANRFLEGHPQCLQETGSGALAIADNGRQHDRAIDLPAARLLGGRGSGLQHAQELAVRTRLRTRFCPHVFHQPTKIAGYIRAEPSEINIGSLQDQPRLDILGQGEEQVLECDKTVGLIARTTMRALQALAQPGRHGNRSELLRKRLRHQLPPDAVRNTPQRLRPSRQRVDGA